MQPRLRLATRGASAGLLAAAAALTLGPPSPHPVRRTLTGSGTSLEPSPERAVVASTRNAFGITGSVTGLYPGRSTSLQLTVANPQHHDITVTSIATTVGNASASCPSSYLQVTEFAGSVLVAAQHQVTVTVTASMLASAPDGCQGANFPLVYSGIGEVP